MKTTALLTLIVAALATTASVTSAHAATNKQVMFSRYLKYQFCMEKSYGEGYAERLHIELKMNRWGVSEPTFTAYTKMPAAMQKVDARCRVENELGLEPRPR